MGIIDWIYPKRCVGCGREGKYLCLECFKEVRRAKPRGAEGGRGKVIERLVVGYEYRGLVQKAMKQVKYKSAWGVVEELAVRWSKLVTREVRGEWVVTGVPLYERKRRERGFNQAERLGRKLAIELGTEYRELLVRVRATRPQYGMSGKERARNVAGAFGWVGGESVKQVLLVDDVWTTGSTMRECAKVLREAGTEKVWAAALAG